MEVQSDTSGCNPSSGFRRAVYLARSQTATPLPRPLSRSVSFPLLRDERARWPRDIYQTLKLFEINIGDSPLKFDVACDTGPGYSRTPRRRCLFSAASSRRRAGKSFLSCISLPRGHGGGER